MRRNPRCTLCPLHQGARTVCMDGSGPDQPDILIVGQNPGQNEDRQGRPFVGQSGKIIRHLVEKAGLGDLKIRYTNIVRCLSPGNRAPTAKEIKACKPYLDAEIAAVKPKHIVTLGAVPTKPVTKQAKISTAHGKIIEKDGITMMAAYHPAATLRSPNLLKVIEQDLGRLRRHIDGTLGETQDTFTHRVVLTRADLAKFWQEFEAAEEFAFDTETNGLFVQKRDFVIRCIGIALRQRSWVIPLQMPGSMYENQHNRQEAFMRVLVRHAAHKWGVAFHGKYDNNALQSAYGLTLPLHFDSMLAHYVLDENQDHDLKYVARIELDSPEYDLPKNLKNSDTPEWLELMQDPTNRAKYWEYNGRDAWNTLHLYYKFNQTLRRNAQLRRLFYRLVIPSSHALAHAELEGLPLNPKRYAEVEKQTQLELSAAKDALDKRARPVLGDEEINWDSYKQVGRVLYGAFQLPVLQKTPTGEPSTSEAAVVDLKGKHLIVDELLRYRELHKTLSTYLVGWKQFIVNNRLYLTYKQTGTVTGRFSSRLHSIPTESDIRSIIEELNDDWEFFAADLSQAELRVAAELSGDLSLIDAYRAGRDVHWETVLFMIGAGHMPEYTKHALETARTLAEIVRNGRPLHVRAFTLSDALEALRIAGTDNCAKVWKGWKDARTKAKRINFGFLYGMYENKFIEKAKVDYDWHCTWKEAHGFRTGFFELRPGLVDWHTRCKQIARLDGYVTNLFGRVRRLPALHSTDREARSEAERQAINSPVQGTIGDWKAAAMVEIDSEIDKDSARLCGEHHDALLGVVRKSRKDEVLPRIRRIMQRPKLLRTFNIDMKVPMVVDINIGAWGAGKVYRDPT